MHRRHLILGLLVCSALACVRPTAAVEKPLVQFPRILAHRGGMHEFEENTMAAFRASYELGIRAFETDIRMTRDGVLVVLHDDTLDRTHNATGSVESKTADELRNVTDKKGQKFLFLEELLDHFADKPGVYIELEMKTSNKNLYPDERIAEYCQKLHALATAKKPKDSYYAFTSFDERPLKAIRALDAEAPIGIIDGKPLSPEFIERAKRLKAQVIACQLNGTSRTMVREAQKQGFKINCWAGHTPQDFLLGVGLGVDISCTDIPKKIQSVKEMLIAD
jgi:glycerophosphoryl diester phosphodiesterase